MALAADDIGRHTMNQLLIPRSLVGVRASRIP